MDSSNTSKKINIIDVNYSNIDLEVLENLKLQAEKLFANNSYYILMDLTNVSYLSSTGLGLLVYINNKCNEQNGKFGIYGLQDYTLDMIKLTKLDLVISIFKNREDAEQKFIN